MILVYVINKDVEKVRELIPRRSHFRNPKFFDGVEQAEKVLIHGLFPKIDKAYNEAGIPVFMLDHKGDEIKSEPDKEPNENWTIKELKAFAKLKGIKLEVTKKKDILDVISNSTRIH